MLQTARKFVKQAKATELDDDQLIGVVWMACRPDAERCHPGSNGDSVLHEEENYLCGAWWSAWIDHPKPTLRLLIKLRERWERPTRNDVRDSKLANELIENADRKTAMLTGDALGYGTSKDADCADKALRRLKQRAVRQPKPWQIGAPIQRRKLRSKKGSKKRAGQKR